MFFASADTKGFYTTHVVNVMQNETPDAPVLNLTREECLEILKTQDNKDKFLQALCRTPQGMAKVRASLYSPMLQRWFYRSIAFKIFCRNASDFRCAYVPSDAGAVSVDVPSYSGESLEGEETISGSSLWAAFTKAQSNIVDQIVHWETKCLLQLLRGLPGYELVTGDFNTCLDQIKQKVCVRGVVLGAESPAVREWFKRSGSFYPHGCPPERRDVPLYYNRYTQGECWVLGDRAGFCDHQLEFEVHPFRLKWRATLGLGIANPEEVFKVMP